MVEKLVEASQYINRIYWRQSDPEGLALYSHLASCIDLQAKRVRRYLMINGSRYDLLDDNKPFADAGSYSPGRALYPPGALWEDAIPDPEFAGGIVVDVIDPLRERLTGAHSP